jgi:hypothetical protein
MPHTETRDTLSTLFRKLNLYSGAFFLSLILAVAGVVMVFRGITGEGSIDVKAPFMSGTLKTGFVGLVFVFFGVVVSLGTAYFGSRRTQEVIIQIDKLKLTYKNVPYDKLIQLNAMVKDLRRQVQITEDTNATTPKA